MELIERLRQRKLVQWALAYVAFAFALLQGIDIVAQQFAWSDAVRRGITIALAIGFFVALVLAWYHGERGAQRVSGAELLILALLLAIGGGVLWWMPQHAHRNTPGDAPEAARDSPRAASATAQAPAAGAPERAAAGTAPAPVPANDKSVAVLPFANLSDDKANAYFADGMQDEILTKLAKIGALRVISRTSTRRLASAPENLGEIARQLGVANVLEGSVQKAGNAVHINVQLIRAASDEHLWAESYDRTLENIFGVEGEVAQKVAEALKATLTGAERQAVAAKGTENARAYEAYLRGRATDNLGYSFTKTQRAIDNYLEAVREDPAFAQAWAAAATAMSSEYFNGFDTERSTPAAVKAAADKAMALQPELAESLLARGAYLYYVERDYADALDVFKRALAKQPGDADTLGALFFVERRLDRWDDSIAHYREVLARDPRNVSVIVQGAIEIFFWLRRYDETRALLESALKIAPDDSTARACLALVEQSLGRLDAADVWLARVPKDSPDYYEGVAQIDQRVYRRDLAGLAALMAPAIARDDAALSNVDIAGLIKLGFLQRASGPPDAARRSFERLARAIASRPGGIDHVTGVPPLTPLVAAGLGEYDKAVAAAQQQIAAHRNDSLERARAKIVLAQIFAQKGDRDAAIAAIPELLEMPAGITPALLVLDPLWDPVRADPRFVALTRQPLATYKAPAP